MKIVFSLRTFDNKYEQSTWIGSSPNLSQGEFEIDNHVFTTTLKYIGWIKNSSSFNIEWLDTNTDYVYYSTMKVLDDALLNAAIKGNLLTGTFTFYQVGSTILLKQI
jgi:hypothetical protein